MSGQDPEWHGWSRGRVSTALHIGPLPLRKAVCLYTVDRGVIRTHAFFKDVEQARAVMALIDHLVGMDGEAA